MERRRIAIERERLAGFCWRNHIHRPALFGSVLRDDFGPDSDVDALVEFEPGRVPGLRFFALERELSEILGRKVDLNTPRPGAGRVRGPVCRVMKVPGRSGRVALGDCSPEAT
ncbi:MAG: nucleotidyltransferase family protein [Deltaproteobacteria bacterium]|nr:nucleotidyltransferase family protein [Deltaproteobacteria bacterium]